ncbi:Fc.00g015710.m01.CDS01 [Cosmosporella sp. VM-42]
MPAAPTYIISRVADPIFAVFIGLSAAATRINREEKAKGHTTNQTLEAGFRRLGFPQKSS